MKSWQTSEQPSNCFPGEGEGNLVEENIIFFNIFIYLIIFMQQLTYDMIIKINSTH